MVPAGDKSSEGDEPARLRIAVFRLAKRLKPTSAAGALTTTEVDVINTVARIGPVKLSELAGQTGLNPTMLSRVVSKLEEHGLLRRLGDALDGRVCRVEVTAAGGELRERVRSERNDVLSSELALLPAGARSALLAALPALESLAERLLDRSAPDAPEPNSR
ncbi:MAG: MarR family winged helix-turn-helix transcriptional regulator [Actinomycetota bacterium]|jgi:DNA-binding MarR family transcriptional regulator|nr:MarR family winged helix-turn-helix transcriptional regulator [Actinomycetota bacterium]